jgi:hypothetical protein
MRVLTVDEIQRLLKDHPELRQPTTLTLACGHTVANRPTQRVWNHYDWRFVSQNDPADERSIAPDTSGRLPHGVTYWVFDGCGADNSRVTCVDCAPAEHEEVTLR